MKAPPSWLPIAVDCIFLTGLATFYVVPAKADQYELGEIVVVGMRPGLATAQEIKRNKQEIVDSVVAEDICKLPDHNVAEAMQRITGVQVMRDRGEGNSISIRGLSQVETLFNGREIFTAGNGRNLNFIDIPSDLVSGIDVYKSSSAAQIEGGLGGIVDLRTYRPFDFHGKKIVASGRLVNGDLAGKTRPQAALLASNQWQTSHGRFGALFDFAYQQRAYREDYKDSGSTTSGGQAVPGSSTQTTNVGDRDRLGAGIVLQWQPDDTLDLYAELHHVQLKTIEDAAQLFISNSGSPTSVSPVSGDALSVTWPGASIASLGAARDTLDRTTQVALGGRWRQDALTLKADLSHTRSYNNLLYSGLYLSGATATGFSQNVGTSPQSTSIAGVDLLNLGSYSNAAMLYASRPFEGDMTALKLDGEYKLNGYLIESLSAGMRYARRAADDGQGQVSFGSSVAAANAAGAVIAYPYGDFFPGSTSVGNYLVGNADLARNVDGLRSLLGISTALPSSNPLGTWSITENTGSVYLMASIRSQAVPLDGNLGLRVVRTGEAVDGRSGQVDASNTLIAGTEAPIHIDHRYTDYLPSLNLRYRLADGLYLRGAASKTVTRPDFNQISPSLTLNVVQFTGGAGNPTLRPIRADNYDVALEKYFDRTTSVYLTGFLKNVDGFIANVINPETYGGVTYWVGRPYNTGAATITGFETGYQQFYDFLPGWLGGLGLQLNYTYVDSRIKDSSLPLQGLSPNSYNIIGMYERGPVSARIAYNWRDRFMSGQTGSVPIYTKGYGWLDASVRYRLDKVVTLALEGSNLLRTRRASYYGVETRPQTVWLNDRQIAASVTVNFR